MGYCFEKQKHTVLKSMVLDRGQSRCDCILSRAEFCWWGPGANIEDGSSLIIHWSSGSTNWVSTISSDSALTRLPLAVYARFKSVNLKNTTNKKYIILVGPLLAMAPWTS